jgi:hypothetical protein
MNKINFLIIMTTIVITNSINSEVSEDILTKNSGFWGPGGEASAWGWSFTFYKGGKLKKIFVGEGGEEIDGTYRIKGNKVFISSDKGYVCSISDLAENLTFKKILVCDNSLQLYGYGHKSIGEKRKINEFDAITLGRIRMIVKENLKFRKEPNQSSVTIKCNFILSGNSKVDFLPSRTIVHAIARTENKSKINRWNNYWFYVSVMYDMHDGESCESDFGWVYSEFLEKDSYQDE